MIRLGPKIDEEVRKAAEQNRAAGRHVAESPIKPLILEPEELDPAEEAKVRRPVPPADSRDHEDGA